MAHTAQRSPHSSRCGTAGSGWSYLSCYRQTDGLLAYDPNVVLQARFRHYSKMFPVSSKFVPRRILRTCSFRVPFWLASQPDMFHWRGVETPCMRHVLLRNFRSARHGIRVCAPAIPAHVGNLADTHRAYLSTAGMLDESVTWDWPTFVIVAVGPAGSACVDVPRAPS